MHQRVTATLLLGAVLFALYAIWDEPTKGERALAATASALIAVQYGDLPLHQNSAPAPGGKTYTFRPARHGTVVFVSYGLTSPNERARLRQAALKAFTDVPALQAVSLESYEAHVTAGKARFSSRETVLRP
jgi:hypothetical protein